MKRKYIVLSIGLALILIFFCSGKTVIKADSNEVGISYDAHVQNIGWQPWVFDGQEAGTNGQALRVEALKIKLVNAPEGAQVMYRAHVQNIGWQAWTQDGLEAGTDGQNLRIEAIEIKLVNMPGYSVEYSAHVQNIGWQDWTQDGLEAGTEGEGLRVEALRIKIVKNTVVQAIKLNKASDTLKVGDKDLLSVNFSPVDANNKNLKWTSSNANIVSVDESGKITALKVGNAIITASSIDGEKNDTCSVTVNPGDLGITYSTHVQNIGWQNWTQDGLEAGTEGQDLRIEALKIKLVNAPEGAQISYRTHVQNIGWQDWRQDGLEAGTEGQGLRVEALEMKLLNMPNYMVQYQAYVQNVGWQDWVYDGSIAGTEGEGLRIEAIKIKLVKKVSVESIKLEKNSLNLSVGNVDSVKASISPIGATNKNVKWTSSNENVVVVTDSGNIRALSMGTAVITVTSEDGNRTASCTINVNGSSNEENETLSTAKEVLSKIIKPNMTQLEKELAIHDYIVANTQYDTDIFRTTDVPASDYTSYGVLLNHKAVCAGYAEAFKLMCNLEDIPTRTVIDYTINHEWNTVKLNDGNFYQVDVTWDDPLYFNQDVSDISHKYFNISDKQMFADHAIDKNIWDTYAYPVASVDNSEFYSITGEAADNNMVYTSYEGNLSGVDSKGNVKVISNDDAKNIIYDNGLLYYISNDCIYRIDTNGQSKVKIASKASKMYLYNGDIYYLGSNDWAIHRVKLDWQNNSNKDSIVAYTWNSNFFIKYGCLYYETTDHLGLNKIDLNTLSDKEILKVSDYNITNYNDYIYYKDSNKLYRTDLSGGNLKLISSNIVQWIQVYMGYIYYRDDDNSWFRMNLDGNNLISINI
ncbi:Ig-like domain-containing protein [Clostridium felsineum]|uniref:Ig-like domain-containing protein n=1 Tax=Clostridium felsineum TaxID=36839 RepID=UPI00214D9D25|nr:Ig-like domain-containing protein [Clostridium felsineum]MCR3760006.1 Ig-like domain-containing protein [Clostridium felsineum]